MNCQAFCKKLRFVIGLMMFFSFFFVPWPCFLFLASSFTSQHDFRNVTEQSNDLAGMTAKWSIKMLRTVSRSYSFTTLPQKVLPFLSHKLANLLHTICIWLYLFQSAAVWLWLSLSLLRHVYVHPCDCDFCTHSLFTHVLWMFKYLLI